MKKNILTLILLFFLSAGFIAAQSPQAINYQGVARDASNQPLLNQAIGLQFTIRSGSAAGTVEYQETHAVTTNDLGLFTLKIGQGTAVSGTFSAIDWGNNTHFVEVEIDPAGGSSYQSLTNTELASVPYALHASTVENDAVDDADADPTNEYNTGATLAGTVLTITDGGGSQNVDLVTLQDGVNDADADSTNELQTLSLSGDTLTISDGNSVVLPGGGGGSDADWTISGNDIHNTAADSGRVSVGLTAFPGLMNIGSTDSFKVFLGHVGNFNEAESGRLVFSEDITFNGTCGFEFHHNGATNTLSLESGCTALNDTSIVFTRNGEVRIPERVKIGENTNPSADVHIKQSGTGTSPGASGLRLENSTTTDYNQLWTDGTNLNISRGASRIAFINNVGAYNQVSDRRMKANILNMTPVLSGVLALNPVQYNYIYEGAEDQPVFGFIAQDVQKIFPGMVGTSPGSDLLAIPYAEFSVVAIKAIQEQQTIIENQQAEIDALKKQVNEINALKEAIQRLEAQMK